MTQPTQTPAPLPPVKGSWEDLLMQGQSLAAQQNDQAIPIFQKVIDRLVRIPEPQRLTANRRLQGVLVRAAVDLQYYLTYRDRYAEALAVNALVRPTIDVDEIPIWDKHAASLQIMAGNVDQGLAQLGQLAEAGDLDDWGELLFKSIASGRLDLVAEAVQGAEVWVNRRWNRQFDQNAAKRDQAYLAYFKARLALEQGQIQESTAWYEHAMSLDSFFRDNPQYLYGQLMEVGAHKEALPLIRRDQKNPIRAGFWYGLWHWRTGEAVEAERLWRKVIQTTLPEEGPIDILELVLSHYYLGDAEGIGLGSVLDLLRQRESDTWLLFYLAGLGWAMRDDAVAARSNLQLAVMRRKSRAEGKVLDHSWWPFVVDLLEPERQQTLVEFFENAQIQRRT